jgi:hypothetical protein
VDGQHSSGGRTDCRLRRLVVDQAGSAVDVDADWDSPGVSHRERGRDERVRGDDHFVVGSYSRRLQHDRERRGARPDADAMGHPTIRGELRLEPFELFAEHEPARSHHAIECVPQIVNDRPVLSAQIHKWHRMHAALLPHLGVPFRAPPLPIGAMRNAMACPIGWEAWCEKVHELRVGRPRARFRANRSPICNYGLGL